jgi:hypothetical protein
MNSSDQVDLDSCSGYVENNEFFYNSIFKGLNFINNPKDDNGDGLDFSGSKVIVKNNSFNGFLDKGISVGEKTKAFIISNNFSNNRSALTVKDQSNVYLYNNSYDNNVFNLEMYQKKKLFNHPSVYNINDEYDENIKIKKSPKSYYFKSNNSIKPLESGSISNIFKHLEENMLVENE